MKYIAMIIIIFICFQIYESQYYKSKRFANMRNRLIMCIENCNELNRYIESLKNYSDGIQKKEYGTAQVVDSSNWNFKRPEQAKATPSKYIHDCSASVVKNASQNPYKYLCKYFNVEINEATLVRMEQMLNDFMAIDEGKKLLTNELENIKQSIQKDIPILIKWFGTRNIMTELGFQEINFKATHFKFYTFRYVSPGGNKTSSTQIFLDINGLNNFIQFLQDSIKTKKSQAGQRALMTPKLREQIKQRDNYTCQNCKNSTYNEPNLLLEIDHIIPISKGGVTTEDNLQVLCWKCNRSKGNKII